jgi:hypothetical protein
MSHASKKQRHKAKRDAKRLAARRQDSISPVKRLADARGEIECWRSGNFESQGQMQLFVYKRAAGLNGIACFLVDRGVVGLKDAWTKMRVDREELEHMLEASGERGIQMTRCTLDDVRRMVAGGIRWAHENGMRLPKDWAKAASVIGGVGDWASADVSAFVREFVGHPDDLRQRLIGKPFDEYIQQKDIKIILSDNAPLMDLRTGEYLQTGDEEYGADDDDEEDDESDDEQIPLEELQRIASQFDASSTALAAETTQWLAARNQTPASLLAEAWRSVLLAAMLSKTALPEGSERDIEDLAAQLLEDMSRRIEESLSAEYQRSIDQVLLHLKTDAQVMQNAVLTHGLTHDPARQLKQ